MTLQTALLVPHNPRRPKLLLRRFGRAIHAANLHALAAAAGLEVEVLDEEALEKGGFGGIFAGSG